MKKSVVKILSTILVLIMMLSVLPMSAFASEVNVPENNSDEETATTFAVCSHIFYVKDKYDTIPCSATQHRLYHYEIYTCSLCGAQDVRYVGYTVYSHTMEKGVCKYCGYPTVGIPEFE